MAQLTLLNEKIEHFCPKCNNPLKDEGRGSYADDFQLNGISIDVKCFSCVNCKQIFTYFKCIYCGKEFLDEYPKNRIDCFHAYCCPDCRQDEAIEEKILDKLFPIKYCEQCGLSFPSKQGEEEICDSCKKEK